MHDAAAQSERVQHALFLFRDVQVEKARC
jgi:hypothetical protein